MAMCGMLIIMDPRCRAVAALASVVVTAGLMSACAEWQAQVAQDRGMPFGSGEFEGRVDARSGLHVRAGPTTGASSLTILVDGTEVQITCKAPGETIDGNSTWHKLGDRRWVSARYVTNVGAPPRWCD